MQAKSCPRILHDHLTLLDAAEDESEIALGDERLEDASLDLGAARHHWVGLVHHHKVIRQHRADDAIGDVGFAGTQEPHAASWPHQRVELLRLTLAHDVEVDPLAARYRLQNTCVPG